jgi:hypothetical protein
MAQKSDLVKGRSTGETETDPVCSMDGFTDSLL